MAPRESLDEYRQRNRSSAFNDAVRRRKSVHTGAQGGSKSQQQATAESLARRNTNADAMRAYAAQREAYAAGEPGRQGIRDGFVTPGKVQSGIQNLLQIIQGSRDMGAFGRSITEAREQEEEAQANSLGEALSYLKLSAPSLESYVGPYDEAKTAAQDSYGQAKGVINDEYAQLGTNLNAQQDAHRQEAAALEKQQMMARRLGEANQAKNLQSSVLESELGVDGAVQGEVALLEDLQRQANQGSDALADRMDVASAAEHSSRVQGVEGSRAAAQSNASVNLSALLSEIGLARAGAVRQHGQDSNAVANQNAQNEQRARESFQKQEEQRAKDEQKYEKDQRALLSKFEVDPWDGDNLDLRMRNNPKATAFFMEYKDLVGGKRDGASKHRALAQLDEAIAVYQTKNGIKLNPQVMRNWIDEYYSNKKIVDEQGYFNAGGEERFLGR